MAPPTTVRSTPRLSGTHAILSQVLKGVPVDHVIDHAIRQCQGLTRLAELEDVAAVIEALFDSHELDQVARDKLFTSFVAAFHGLTTVEPTARSIAESTLALFFVHDEQLLASFLDRVSDCMASASGTDDDGASPTPKTQLASTGDSIQQPYFIQDATDALSFGVRLVPLLTSVSVSSTFLSHTLTGIQSFDRDVRGAALKLLPVVIHSLQGLGQWNSVHVDSLYSMLKTMQSSPILLADLAQFGTIFLPIVLSSTSLEGLSRIVADTALMQGLLSSLSHTESSSRKFAIHCLKQIVDTIQALPPKMFATFTASCTPCTLFPILTPVAIFTAAWNDFFMAYDLIAESYHHLMKPSFALLNRNLAASIRPTCSTIPTQWWLAVLERGFINDSLASRKMVLQYILSASDPNILAAFASHRPFLESLVAACEPAVMYQVNVQGAFVSPFGESLALFWSRTVLLDQDLVPFLVNKLAQTRAHVLLLFGLHGLALAAKRVQGGHSLLASTSLQSVLQLTQNPSPISNNSRRLVEQLVLDIVLSSNGDAASDGHSVDDVFLVCSYLTFFDHPCLASWIRGFIPTAALIDHMLKLMSEPRALSMAISESKSLAFVYHALEDTRAKATVRDALVDTVNQVYTHPYLAPGIPEQRIALVLALADPELTDAVGANVASYILMQLSRVSSVDVLDFYLQMVPVFAPFVDPNVAVAQAKEVLNRADDGSIELQLAKVLAMRFAEHFCGVDSGAIPKDLIQSALLTRPASAQVHWNDLVTKFVALKWNCLTELVAGSRDCDGLTDLLLDELESDHREGSVPLIHAVTRLIAPADSTRFARALGICWSMVLETTSLPKHFNVLYPAFLHLFLAPKFVREAVLQPLIESYMQKVIEIGSTKFTVVSMAAEALYKSLDGHVEMTFQFRKTIVQWIMYGPARDRDEERLETVWLKKLGSDLGANTDYTVRVLGNALAAQLAKHPQYGPDFYALLMDTFFSPELNPALEFPNQPPNRAKLRLISTVLVMTPHAVTPKAAKAHFTRVMDIFDGEPCSNIRPYCEWLLALLALHNLPVILPQIFAALQQYNGRPVKITSILFVASYLLRALHDWTPALGPATTAYPAAIPTASVAHVHLLDLVQSVFRSVTCWLASNHFTIRLHTQWLLERAWHVCTEQAASGTAASTWHELIDNPAHKSLHACLTTNKDCVKFKAKYLEPGYMTNDFHPLRDLAWEFVFHLLPRIVPDNSPDEFVSSRAFAHVRGAVESLVPLVATGEQGRHMLLKHEHVEDLVRDPAAPDFVAEQVTGITTAAPPGERIKAGEETGTGAAGKGKGGGRGAKSKNAGDVAPAPMSKKTPPMPKEEPSTESIHTSLDPALPVQRKINPWAAMLQSTDLASTDPTTNTSTDRLAAMQAAIRTQGVRGRLDLVVCASLVELNTNLGGLARTCEIFGLRGLTVHSANILTDPLFRTLAVSADRHLPMEQVARGETLVAWLRDMKRKHYTIVALEQTSASVSLEKVARFPEKMVLLLGKEKEGVPSDLLREVDMCIEIPQLGVTRSLNVHNAACTIAWEYVRRKLVD